MTTLDALTRKVPRSAQGNAGGGFQEITQEQRDRFLEALKDGGGVVKDACRAARFSRQYAYHLRKRNAAFREALAEAVEVGTEVLEQEAHRRAVDGSDVLAMFLLRARRPGVYRERQEVHHTGGVGVAVGDLAAIRAAGVRPELAAAFDLLADALGAEAQAPHLLEPGDAALTSVDARPTPRSRRSSTRCACSCDAHPPDSRNERRPG